MRHFPIVPFLLLVLVAGCSALTTQPDPGSERSVGIVESQYLRAPALVSPDTVTAGQAFQVTVTTLGYNGCWRADGAEVTTAAGRATIVPYDRVAGEICTAALVELPRTVSVRFDARGGATLVLEGRRELSDGTRVPTRIERSVTVR